MLLAYYKKEPTSIHELWTRMEKEWEEVNPKIRLNLIESMSRRIQAEKRARDGHAKY